MKRKALHRPAPKEKKFERFIPEKPKTLGGLIKEARKKAKLTQLALAHAIGYTGDDAGAYICRVESGTQEPRLDTLQRIAVALGVPVCSLLGGK